MPFDGVETPFSYLAKFDQIIGLIEATGKWVKHTYRTPDDRHCLKEVLNVVGVAEVFEPIILQVAAARMGREFCCIESFNDHPKTLRRDVVAVLRQTREEIVAGKFAVPGAETVMPAVQAERRVGNHGSWPATLWRRLFACN